MESQKPNSLLSRTANANCLQFRQVPSQNEKGGRQVRPSLNPPLARIRGRMRAEPQPLPALRSNGILNILWRRLANRNVLFLFTTAIDAMTSSGHVTSSVTTSPFDSAWTGHFPIGSQDNCNARTQSRGVATGVDIGIYTPSPQISPSKLFTG